MNPSDENKSPSSSSSTAKSKILPGIVLFLLITTISGILLYFNTGPETQDADLAEPSAVATIDSDLADKGSGHYDGRGQEETIIFSSKDGIATIGKDELDPESAAGEQAKGFMAPETLQETGEGTAFGTAATSIDDEVVICSKATQQLDNFYSHLDKQPYMADYGLTTSSQEHFTTLVKKLLANPPQVARESDDLYTILKNTAHFFRISGKNNILMMKGILDKEKGYLEQILADYYLLVTTPDCEQTPYATGIDNKALYEYAGFFLNTMGGRLYLFRRDSQSRMVVTYYAILLIDQANQQQNNRHGIALKPSVDMLIAEMEAGGSTLKQSDLYLDTLYDLKEKYQ